MNLANMMPERVLNAEDTANKRVRKGEADQTARNVHVADEFPQYLQRAADESSPSRQSAPDREEPSACAPVRLRRDRFTGAKADGADGTGENGSSADGDGRESDGTAASAAADPLAALMALVAQSVAVSKPEAEPTGEADASPSSGAGVPVEAGNVTGGVGTAIASVVSSTPAQDAAELSSSAEPAIFPSAVCPEVAPSDGASLSMDGEAAIPVAAPSVPVSQDVYPDLGNVDATGSADPVGITVLGKERHLAPVEAKPLQDETQVKGPDSLALEIAAPEVEGGATREIHDGPVTGDEGVTVAAEAFPGSPQGGSGFQDGAAGQNPSFAGSAPALGIGAQGAPESKSFPSPSEQIATKISELLSGAAVAAAGDQSAAAPVQVLRIQLQPAELGEITVKLTLKQNVLELQIEAVHRDTARFVEKDREVLSGMLSAAGYAVEGLSVRLSSSPEAAAPQSTDLSGGAHSGSEARSQSGSAEPERRGSGSGRRGATDGGQTDGEKLLGDGAGNVGKGRERASSGGGVYV